MFLFDVTRDFDLACKKMLENNAHLNVPWSFIKDHERRPKVLDAVCRQVIALERKAQIKKHLLNPRTKYEVIAASAQLFVKMAIQQRDQSVLSEADKTLIQEKDKAMREVEEMGILQERKSVQVDYKKR